MLNPITNQELDVLYQVIKQYIVDNTAGKITPANMRLVLAAMVEDSRLAKARLDALTTNQVRGSVFRVPYIVIADGLPTVPTELIPPRFRILGMDARAVNGAAEGSRADPIDFRLMYYATGNVVALVDEKPTTTATVRARWVRTSGTNEQKVASYLELPLEGIPLMAGEVYKYTFLSGETRLVEVRHDISQFQNPTPTGLDSDPYYAPYAPLRVDTGISQEYVDAADAELHLDINDLDIRVTQVENDADALDGRMDAVEARPLPPTTTTGLAEGTNKYFTTARVLGTALAGYVKAASRAITASDSVLIAIGLLEKKADDNAASLTNKADLAFGKVALRQIPIATAQDVQDGSSATVLVTPAVLRQSGIAFGSDLLVGDWNPTTNTPYLYELYGTLNSTNVKGRYYRISASSNTVTTTTTSGTRGDTYISVASTVGLGGPMIVSGPGIPVGTRVAGLPGGGTVVLDRNVTLAGGEVLTFTTYFAGFASFTVGDYMYWDGFNWFMRRLTPTAALAAGTGTAVTFDMERRWPIITSGTYAVSATGATIDVCFQLILAVGCTAIALSGVQFVKLSATSFDATKENTYSFLVRFDGKIEYYISQPQ